MKVAVALIVDEQDRLLIAQRPYHASHGGFWEFPGGKLEVNETAEDALKREIREEVGLEILHADYLGEIKHQYPDKSVHLLLYYVTQFSGKAACLEGQLDLKWVHTSELNPKDFPEGNQAIFPMLEQKRSLVAET